MRNPFPRRLAFWFSWPILGPLLLLLACLSMMWLQSLSDLRDLREKAATRVAAQADTVAYNLQGTLQALRHVGRLAAEQAGQGGAADQLARLARLYGDSLPGLELALFRGDTLLAASDAMAVRALDGALARQRARLRQGGAGSAFEFAGGMRDGQLRLAHSYGAGAEALVVQLVLPGRVLEDILRSGQADSQAAVLLTDQAHRLLLRYPDAAGIPAGQPLPQQPGTPFSAQHAVLLAHSPFDGEQRVLTWRVLPLVQGEQALRLSYSVSWSDYRANWSRSAVINSAIGLLLVAGFLAHCRAHWRQRHDAAVLRQAARQLQQVLAQLPLAVAQVGAQDGRLRYANPALVEQFGALAGAGQPLALLFPAGADWQAACNGTAPPAAMLTRAGERFMQIRRTDMDGEMLLTFADATEAHLRQQQLHSEARSDALTGLPNRRQFSDEAARLLAEAAHSGAPLHVLALDLDFFKRVNDTHGHDVGDLVLQQAARLLQGALRQGDVAARLGGEEFAALLPGASLEQAQRAAERVRAAIANTPLALPDGTVLTQTVSIGLASHAPDADSIEATLKLADLALYQAKEGGRNRVALYQPTENP